MILHLRLNPIGFYKYSHKAAALEDSADLRRFIHVSIDAFYRRMNWPLPPERWLLCWVHEQTRADGQPPLRTSEGIITGQMTLQKQAARTTYFDEKTFQIENEVGLLMMIGTERIPFTTSSVSGDLPHVSLMFTVAETRPVLEYRWVRLGPDV